MHFTEDLAANLKNHCESVIVFYYSIPMDMARDAFASLGVPFKEMCYRVDLFSLLGRDKASCETVSSGNADGLRVGHANVHHFQPPCL